SSLWRLERCSLLLSSQPDSSPTLLPDCRWCIHAAVHFPDVSPVAVVGRTRRSLRPKITARHWASDRRHRVCALCSAWNWGQVLDDLLSRSSATRTGNGDKRCAPHDDGNEFCF